MNRFLTPPLHAAPPSVAPRAPIRSMVGAAAFALVAIGVGGAAQKHHI